MPIKGISDRKRLVRVGKLHLGIKKKSAKGVEYPSQTDYFVCKEEPTTPAESVAAFKDVYGDQPKALDIVFPTDDELQYADQNYKSYSSSWALVCRGDGEEAMAKWDLAQDGIRPKDVDAGTWANARTKSWVYRKIPCLGPECPMQATEKPQCKAVMNLQFFLPLVRGVGVWQIDTGSWNAIRNVMSCIETVKAITGGRVRGVPLRLSLVQKEVTPSDQAGGVVAEGATGSVKKKTVWVLHVGLPSETLPEMLAKTAQLPEKALLPAPPVVDEEEAPEDLFPAATVPEGVDEETGEIVEGKAQPVRDPANDVTVSPPEADEPNSPTDLVLTLGDFLNRCLEQYNLPKPKVLELLHVEDENEITNFSQAWRNVQRAMGQPGLPLQ